MGNNQPDTFQLTIQPLPHTLKTYRMLVEVYHRSDQVVRFKISGGNKFLKMEKQLIRKSGNWKILERNFEFSANDKDNALLLFELRNRLDEWLEPKDNKPYHWQNKD